MSINDETEKVVAEYSINSGELGVIIEETSSREGNESIVDEEIIEIAENEEAKAEEEEEEDLFNKQTASFRCLQQILISRSSLLRHPLYNFPPLTDPGLDAAFNYVPPEKVFDDTGCEKYKSVCEEHHIVPISRVLRYLPTEELDLKYYGLTIKQIQAVTEALMLNIYVKKLVLQDNWMSPEGAYYVGEMMRENNTILTLNLRECRIGSEGAEKLNEGLMTTQVLRELDLSFNDLGDDGINAIKTGLAENGSLKVLNLSHNELGDGTCATFEQLLVENQNLEELNLSWNNIFKPPALKKLCNGLTNNKSIRRLDLSWNTIAMKTAVKWLARYIKASQQLEHFDISNNRLAGAPVRMMRGAILNSPSLQTVRLGNNLITPDEATSLVKVFTTKPDNPLRQMDLENICCNKDIIPMLNKIRRQGKTVKTGEILCNFEIHGPDTAKLLFARAKYLAMKPKKKKQRKDFGHFILQLPEQQVTKQEFLTLIKKNKIKKLDDSLKKSIMDQFTAKKQKIDLVQMKDEFMKRYPETVLPPPKPKKKKKRKKKGKKGKQKADAAPEAKEEKKTKTKKEGKTKALPDESNIQKETTALPGDSDIPAETQALPDDSGVHEETQALAGDSEINEGTQTSPDGGGISGETQTLPGDSEIHGETQELPDRDIQDETHTLPDDTNIHEETQELPNSDINGETQPLPNDSDSPTKTESQILTVDQQDHQSQTTIE